MSEQLRIPPSFQNFTQKSVHYLNFRENVHNVPNRHIWSLFYVKWHSKKSFLLMKSVIHNRDVINHQFSKCDQKTNKLLFSITMVFEHKSQVSWCFRGHNTGPWVFDFSPYQESGKSPLVQNDQSYIFWSLFIEKVAFFAECIQKMITKGHECFLFSLLYQGTGDRAIGKIFL